jgi:hypothetical protein
MFTVTGTRNHDEHLAALRQLPRGRPNLPRGRVQGWQGVRIDNGDTDGAWVATCGRPCGRYSPTASREDPTGRRIAAGLEVAGEAANVPAPRSIQERIDRTVSSGSGALTGPWHGLLSSDTHRPSKSKGRTGRRGAHEQSGLGSGRRRHRPVRQSRAITVREPYSYLPPVSSSSTVLLPVPASPAESGPEGASDTDASRSCERPERVGGR